MTHFYLGFSGYGDTIRRCFLGLLGDFDLDSYISGRYPVACVIVLLIYVVVVSILLLNLLIAMMGDTYADVKKSAKQLWFVIANESDLKKSFRCFSPVGI